MNYNIISGPIYLIWDFKWATFGTRTMLNHLNPLYSYFRKNRFWYCLLIETKVFLSCRFLIWKVTLFPLSMCAVYPANPIFLYVIILILIITQFVPLRRPWDVTTGTANEDIFINVSWTVSCIHWGITNTYVRVMCPHSVRIECIKKWICRDS
jgi:hypothetical protein